jgi:HD-GYP domain-containing protein (c-di-GMP phosphodiesterase class II)
MAPGHLICMLRPATLAGRTFFLVTLAMTLVLGIAFDTGLIVRSRHYAVMAIAAAVVLAFVAAAVTHSITRPLQNLMAKINEPRPVDVLAPAFPGNSGVQEVNRLAEVLNTAARSSRELQADLERAYFQFVETMAQALDARDPYTAGHSLRVGAYAYAIAREMALPEHQAETIRIAGQLHDIGKIGIPDAILQKPGPLTFEEFGLVKLHPQIGRKILEKVGRFDKLLAPVELHHERQDGKGYPYGLVGKRIPIEARILQVADCFDAMTTSRAYRIALPLRDAIGELQVNAGSQFDAEIVEVFLKLIADGKQEDMLIAPEPRLLVASAVFA